MDTYIQAQRRQLLVLRRELCETQEQAAATARANLDDAVNRAIIETAIDLTDICELSGISRSTLYRRFRLAIDARTAAADLDAASGSNEIAGQLDIDGYEVQAVSS